MRRAQQLLAGAALAAVVAASPAPQQLDFAAIAAAPTVATGPEFIDPNADGEQTASLVTTAAITGVATAQATGNAKRGIPNTTYTPYYPALATHYTTDPALSATKTTTAGQACVTQPEAGTYCGFINPLDPCAPQPDGYGPVPTPDTPSAFLAYPQFHQEANAAPTNVPSKDGNVYKQVFKDLNAQVAANSYLGLYTFEKYDVPKCAAECDATDLCTAFNMFVERDPSLNPSNNDSTAPTVWGYYCPNPPSMTSYKCTLFGSNIDASMATNNGQKREDFQIVITGSDGYDKTDKTPPPDCTAPPMQSSTGMPGKTSTSAPPKPTQSGKPGGGNPGWPWSPPSWNPPSWSPPSIPGWGWPGSGQPGNGGGFPGFPWPPKHHPWKKPEDCKGKGIDAPKYGMGSHFFPGPFNPQACSDYAIFQSEFNLKAGKPGCKMFNAFFLYKNGKPHGTYCNLYSSHLEVSWAVKGSYSSGKDRFDVKQSFTWTLDA